MFLTGKTIYLVEGMVSAGIYVWENVMLIDLNGKADIKSRKINVQADDVCFECDDESGFQLESSTTTGSGSPFSASAWKNILNVERIKVVTIGEI